MRKVSPKIASRRIRLNRRRAQQIEKIILKIKNDPMQLMQVLKWSEQFHLCQLW